MPQPVCPIVCVGLGKFGIESIGEWITYIHQRQHHALAFIRARGFCIEDPAVAESQIPRGHIENNELKLSFAPWISQVSDPINPGQISEVADLNPAAYAKVIKDAYADLNAAGRCPDSWPIALERTRPRIVLIGSMNDPFIKKIFLPRKEPKSGNKNCSASFLDALKEALSGQGHADVTGIFFTDLGEHDGQPRDDLKYLDSETRQWDNQFVAFLVSREGIDLNQTPVTRRTLWQAVQPWDAEYQAGARLLARSLLLLLLRASEANPSMGLTGELFSNISRPQLCKGSRLFSIGLGLVTSPKVEATEYLVARTMTDSLERMLHGPFEGSVGYDLPSTPSRLDDAKDDRGRDLFSFGGGNAGQPPRNILDGNYHKQLVEYFTKEIDPKNTNFQIPEHPRLQKLENLNLEDFSLSDRTWWTGCRLPLEPRELLERLRRVCLESLRNALGWKDFWKRLFAPVHGWAKSAFDDSLRERLKMQVRDLDLLVYRLLRHKSDGNVGGLECAIGVLEGMKSNLEFRALDPQSSPPGVPSEINKEFAKSIRDLVWSLRVQEPVQKLSAFFYCLIGSLLLSIGLSYLVKGFYHHFPEPLIRAIVSFVVGPIIGLSLFLVFRLRQIRELKKLQGELAGKKGHILQLLSGRMHEIAEAYKKSYKDLYRIRCQRALSRLLGRVLVRLKSYRKIIRDRKIDLTARINSFEHLPAFRSIWVATPFDQETYELALKNLAYVSLPSPDGYRLPSCDQPFEEEPLRNWLAGQSLKLSRSEGVRSLVDNSFNQVGAALTALDDCLCRVWQSHLVPSVHKLENWDPEKGSFPFRPKPFLVSRRVPNGAPDHSYYSWNFDDMTLIGKSYLLDLEAKEEDS